MPIKYDKLIALMKEKGITSYTFRQNKIIGQEIKKKIFICQFLIHKMPIA